MTRDTLYTELNAIAERIDTAHEAYVYAVLQVLLASIVGNDDKTLCLYIMPFARDMERRLLAEMN